MYMSKLGPYLLFIIIFAGLGCVERVKKEDDNLEVVDSFIFQSSEETYTYIFDIESDEEKYTLRIVIENTASDKIENLKIEESPYMRDISISEVNNVTIESGETKFIQMKLSGPESSFDSLNTVVLKCTYDIDNEETKSLIYIDFEVEDVTLR